MALSEKKIQEEMLKAERDRNKILADIRSACLSVNMAIISVATTQIEMDKQEKAVAVNKAIDTLNQVIKEIDERWEE
jgi:signal transduction histidine kinase